MTRGSVGEGDITEADEELFDRLRDFTAPEIMLEQMDSTSGDDGGDGPGCSCRGDKSKALIASAGGVNGDFGLGDTGNIDITAEGFAGPFAYTALEASDSDALVAWLDENDFTLGDTASTLEQYIEDGGYTFVAVTLVPDLAETPEQGRTLPALSIQSDSNQMEFPARMSSTGMADELRTTVWVLGDETAEIVDGWSSTPVFEVDGDLFPVEAYDRMLREISTQDERSYAAVFSGAFGDGWVTRFDTLAHRYLHTEDPVFDYTGRLESWQVEVIVEEGYENTTIWFWLPLLGLGIVRRRTVW